MKATIANCHRVCVNPDTRAVDDQKEMEIYAGIGAYETARCTPAANRLTWGNLD